MEDNEKSMNSPPGRDCRSSVGIDWMHPVFRWIWTFSYFCRWWSNILENLEKIFFYFWLVLSYHQQLFQLLLILRTLRLWLHKRKFPNNLAWIANSWLLWDAVLCNIYMIYKCFRIYVFISMLDTYLLSVSFCSLSFTSTDWILPPNKRIFWPNTSKSMKTLGSFSILINYFTTISTNLLFLNSSWATAFARFLPILKTLYFFETNKRNN